MPSQNHGTQAEKQNASHISVSSKPIVALIVALELFLRKHQIGEVLLSENLYALSPVDAGVKEAWLSDPEVREVEVWIGPSLPGHALTGPDVLASPLLPGFALPLEESFG